MNSDGQTFSVESGADSGEGAVIRLSINLEQPASHVRLRSGRALGRAEATFAGNTWAAKHYWSEGAGRDRAFVYEFDEPLPAGEIVLQIPLG